MTRVRTGKNKPFFALWARFRKLLALSYKYVILFIDKYFLSYLHKNGNWRETSCHVTSTVYHQILYLYRCYREVESRVLPQGRG